MLTENQGFHGMQGAFFPGRLYCPLHILSLVLGAKRWQIGRFTWHRGVALG
jgi:hypothetical protein